MKLSAHCDYYRDNSYFVVNNKNQITNFRIHSQEKIGYFLRKEPVIGDSVEEIISQKYEEVFLKLLSGCFLGESFNIEKRIKVEGKDDVLLQIVLTPVFNPSDQPYVSCTIIDSNRKSNQMKLLDEYSRLASHDLRAPITNILSLSSLTNFPDMESFDFSRVEELLADINYQAEKLDDIIKMLNRLVGHGQEYTGFISEATKKSSRHIMLVDDDSLTNKLHHMIITKYNKNRDVVQFDNPVAALAYLDLNKPDLILLDLNMPDIDGWMFLDLMKKHKILTDVVIVSSTIDPADRNRANAYPVVKDFLMKPLTYDKIKHLIDD